MRMGASAHARTRRPATSQAGSRQPNWHSAQAHSLGDLRLQFIDGAEIEIARDNDRELSTLILRKRRRDVDRAVEHASSHVVAGLLRFLEDRGTVVVATARR